MLHYFPPPPFYVWRNRYVKKEFSLSYNVTSRKKKLKKKNLITSEFLVCLHVDILSSLICREKKRSALVFMCRTSLGL